MEVLKEHVKMVYLVLSENLDQTLEEFHYDYFKIRDGKLYCRNKVKSLTTIKGKLRSFGEIEKILGREGLHDLGFDIHIGGKVTPRQAVMLNKAEEELPSTSQVAITDDIELQEITENASRSTDNLTMQLEEESSKDLPMRELLDLDKQLRSIRGLLMMEVEKKVQLKEKIKQESASSSKSETIQNTMIGLEKTLFTESKSIMTTYQLVRKASVSSKVD